MKANKFNIIPNEHSGVAHVQQKFTDRNGLAHVERKFIDLALAQWSSSRVTEIHRPIRISTRGIVLTARGYKYLKNTKIQRYRNRTASNAPSNWKQPNNGRNIQEGRRALALKLEIQLSALAPKFPEPVVWTTIKILYQNKKWMLVQTAMEKVPIEAGIL
jgi:hypothetical protein